MEQVVIDRGVGEALRTPPHHMKASIAFSMERSRGNAE